MNETAPQRLCAANALISAIASCGHHFLHSNGTDGFLSIDGRGLVWYHDPASKHCIYTHTDRSWKKFNGGGTMQSLIIALRKFIMHGTTLNKGSLGPWPEWLCDGDPWGYGGDMHIVRAAAVRNGLFSSASGGVE